MKTANVVKLPVARRMECSACGASSTASCDCDAPYIPAGPRAAAAVAKNPEKSDRAIAAEIGVDHKTVSKARKQSTGECSPVETRTGRDGKQRRLPGPRPEPKIIPRKKLMASERDQGEMQRQASINVRPDDWAAFKRRADAQETSAAAVLGMLVRQHLGARAKGRPEPTISNPVAEVNAFHRELVRFTADLSVRLTTWIEGGPPIDAAGKAALMQALYLCADECAQLAQKLDGR